MKQRGARPDGIRRAISAAPASAVAQAFGWPAISRKKSRGGALAVAMIASAAAIYFASDVRIVSTETIAERMRLLGRDIFDMLRLAIPLFTIVLVMSPIGAGAMNGLWSAVAPDWKAEPDRVALVAGILN